MQQHTFREQKNVLSCQTVALCYFAVNIKLPRRRCGRNRRCEKHVHQSQWAQVQPCLWQQTHSCVRRHAAQTDTRMTSKYRESKAQFHRDLISRYFDVKRRSFCVAPYGQIHLLLYTNTFAMNTRKFPKYR